MAKPIQIARLVRIIRLLTTYKKGLSAQEIAERLADEGDEYAFSNRTIRRDFDDIHIAFGIDITLNTKEKVWAIEPDSIADNPTILDHLLLVDAYRKAKSTGSLLLEPQPEKGLEMLDPILTAIPKNVLITFTHYSFGWETTKAYQVLPYAVKEYQGRWYLIATDNKQPIKFKSFALDRISNLEVTDIQVRRKKVDMESFFDHFYGVAIAENESLQKVLLSFNYEQGKYIKTLKLHPSQVVILDNEEEVRVELTLAFPNGEAPYDLVMKLCSFSNSVKVLAPQSLANEVACYHKAAYEQYFSLSEDA